MLAKGYVIFDRPFGSASESPSPRSLSDRLPSSHARVCARSGSEDAGTGCDVRRCVQCDRCDGCDAPSHV